jgi:response regulator of citrate/malate metabolism
MRKVQGLENILLVDDDLLLNFVHKRLIEKLDLDCEVTICNSVKEAMACLTVPERLSSARMSGLIFLDVHMPDFNGWDFLEQYRGLPEESKKNIKIVMLTTSKHPDDNEKVRSFPEVVGFYNKPLTKEKLQKMINNYWES